MSNYDDVDILEKIRNIIDKRYEYKDGDMWDFEVIEDVFKRLDKAYIELARLHLVESAANKLLAAKPTQHWTVDEMNALEDALKENYTYKAEATDEPT